MRLAFKPAPSDGGPGSGIQFKRLPLLPGVGALGAIAGAVPILAALLDDIAALAGRLGVGAFDGAAARGVLLLAQPDAHVGGWRKGWLWRHRSGGSGGGQGRARLVRRSRDWYRQDADTKAGVRFTAMAGVGQTLDLTRRHCCGKHSLLEV
ncbi:hypothetical protein G6O67_002158 [Ophiocordyceps sinensis]|uniref:Uncharacterized protein n=1 Tax=Ophiocordyceps sinensis TaxID=72228 RepID=A0A8H4PTN8_9HYPO|nr:hypothetical protein G6O67_002158 [Ophiocordyceps sinensis]